MTIRTSRSRQGLSQPPSVSDEEFFHRHPGAICRLRQFCRDDRLNYNQSSGYEGERYWIVVAFRDGRLFERYFPSSGSKRERTSIRRRARRWMLEVMRHPEWAVPFAPAREQAA